MVWVPNRWLALLFSSFSIMYLHLIGWSRYTFWYPDIGSPDCCLRMQEVILTCLCRDSQVQSNHLGLFDWGDLLLNFQFRDWDFRGTLGIFCPKTGPAADWAAMTRKLDSEVTAGSRDFWLATQWLLNLCKKTLDWVSCICIFFLCEQCLILSRWKKEISGCVL